MFISAQDLELKPVEFAETYPPCKLDLGPDVTQKGDLKASGRAELIEEHHGGKKRVLDIRVVGKLAGSFEMPCSRCLEPVTAQVKNDFDLLYRPLKAGTQGEEVSISEAETEIGFYQGDGLDTADVVKEQVMLALPLKVLCKQECQGLCPQCGKNRNLGRCDCGEERPDPRWSALSGLRDQLKKH
jgi:uncharacterized protein